MKSIRIMLSGMMILLLGMFCLIADGRTGSWLGGAGVILPILGLIVFAVGIFRRSDID